jgi:hypothetical protein
VQITRWKLFKLAPPQGELHVGRYCDRPQRRTEIPGQGIGDVCKVRAKLRHFIENQASNTCSLLKERYKWIENVFMLLQ